MFKQATPGHHVLEDQVAEGDKVVTRVRGVGSHADELFGIPATGNDIEFQGIAIHRVADGKIVEHWSVVDMARAFVQVGVLQPPGG
jgi:predicted ester cyclase